jgi:O-antigen/teichoic acid export membrane protein
MRVVLSNLGYLLSSSLTMQVSSLVSGMMLTRHLHASGYGQYSFSYLISWFVLLIIMLGTRGVILRDVPRHPERAGDYLVQVLLMRLGLGCLGFVAVLLVGVALDKPPDVQAAMAIFMLLQILDAVTLTFVEIFRGLENMRFESVLHAAERVAVIPGVWFAMQHDWGVVAIAQMMMGLALIRTVAWIWPTVRRLKLPPIRPDWILWQYLARQGLPFWRVDLAMAISQRVDALLLGVLASESDIGRYSAAYTVMLGISVVPQLAVSALQPTSARVSPQDPDSMTTMQLQVASMTIALLVPLVVVVAAYAPWLMGLLFGRTFVDAGFVLRLLVLALPCVGIAGFLSNFLFASDRQPLIFRATIVNAGINLGLNLLLIQHWGMYGAAVATVTSEAAAMIVLFTLCWRELGRRLVKAVWPLVVVGAVCGTFVLWALPLMGWLSVAASGVAYGITLQRCGLIHLKAAR